MTTVVAQDRNRKAAEYLQLLGALRDELMRAMGAIAANALAEFEESVASQQILSTRLTVLADQLSLPLEAKPAADIEAPQAPIDSNLAQQIHAVGDSLQKLNRVYAALIHHSSRTTAVMVSLFASVRGQFQEVSGPRSKYQTWSCRM
jgi:hypothetical protein